jgi:hypothetical protein
VLTRRVLEHHSDLRSTVLRLRILIHELAALDETWA